MNRHIQRVDVCTLRREDAHKLADLVKKKKKISKKIGVSSGWVANEKSFQIIFLLPEGETTPTRESPDEGRLYE